jgi:hypothetical protein
VPVASLLPSSDGPGDGIDWEIGHSRVGSMLSMMLVSAALGDGHFRRVNANVVATCDRQYRIIRNESISPVLF